MKQPSLLVSLTLLLCLSCAPPSPCSASPAPVLGIGYTGNALSNGSVVAVYGGCTGRVDFSSVYALPFSEALSANAWSDLVPEQKDGSTPLGRDGHTSVRVGASCAAAGEGGRMATFGGFNDDLGVTLNDTWVLDVRGRAWKEVAPAGGFTPSNRAGHVAAFDCARGNMYVFGGTATHAGPYLDDMWRLSVAGAEPAWSEVPRRGSVAWPRAQWGHRALLTDGPHVDVFGGVGKDGTVSNQLWRFTYANESWTLLPGGSGSPPKRISHSFVSGGNGTAYLFGGSNSASFFPGPPAPGAKLYNDLWAYDEASASWRQLKPSGTPPCPRWIHAAAVSGSTMVVYGGATATGELLSDVFVYEIVSNTWRQAA